MGQYWIIIIFVLSLFYIYSNAATSYSTSASPAVGVWTDQMMWDRAKIRISSSQQPYYSLYTQTKGRADLNAIPNPFVYPNMNRNISQGGIIYGWTSGGNNSLSEAVNRLQEAGWRLQSYAITYMVTNDSRYAVKLLDYMRPWAQQHTPVNMYDFHIDFKNSNFDGLIGTSFQTDRPWNFALDSMWQTYGLMGISDAYILLKRSGYKIPPSDDTLFRNWIKSVASATNSGFHAWTRWADTHPTSSAYTRYRSDNHLSWSMTGLIAAGVALEDSNLINYIINGGAWQDIKAPLYSNPSSYKTMIGNAMNTSGIMYEQIIGRTPLIGYSYFHIQALMEIAIAGEIATGEDLFNYVATNGNNLKLAYSTYAPYALGQKKSTDPSEATANFTTADSWLYELAYNHWPSDTSFYNIVKMDTRSNFILQGLGPYSIFWCQDLPSGTTTATTKTSTTGK